MSFPPGVEFYEVWQFFWGTIVLSVGCRVFVATCFCMTGKFRHICSFSRVFSHAELFHCHCGLLVLELQQQQQWLVLLVPTAEEQ